ncbi:MAG: manganese catalase family protein [Clostridia bacterium]|nr:manganese catalase family protein [Clostridia bacterium]MBQ9598994.1 manganese catalase family protein [Clostridia bacterium]MBR0089237.1 manganese catalase family protein [Clostridia bacterium]
MFEYKKFLEYPVRVKNVNPRLANVIITQYGGA